MTNSGKYWKLPWAVETTVRGCMPCGLHWDTTSSSVSLRTKPCGANGLLYPCHHTKPFLQAQCPTDETGISIASDASVNSLSSMFNRNQPDAAMRAISAAGTLQQQYILPSTSAPHRCPYGPGARGLTRRPKNRRRRRRRADTDRSTRAVLLSEPVETRAGARVPSRGLDLAVRVIPCHSSVTP